MCKCHSGNSRLGVYKIDDTVFLFYSWSRESRENVVHQRPGTGITASFDLRGGPLKNRILLGFPWWTKSRTLCRLYENLLSSWRPSDNPTMPSPLCLILQDVSLVDFTLCYRGWDFSGCSQISGLRHLSESAPPPKKKKKKKRSRDAFWVWCFTFRIQTLTPSHLCISLHAMW